MSVLFGTWPPVGKAGATPGQANMRLRAGIGIASDGTLGVDVTKAVVSVVHVAASGTYLINLAIALNALTTLSASLLNPGPGEIDATAGGTTIIVHTRDSAGVLADKNFYINVMG